MSDDMDAKQRIVGILEEHKVLASKELAKELNINENTDKFKNATHELIMSGKIDFIRIGCLSSSHKRKRNIYCNFMKKYIRNRLFFLEKKDLCDWVQKQLPKNLSGSDMTTIKLTMRSYGIIMD